MRKAAKRKGAKRNRRNLSTARHLRAVQNQQRALQLRMGGMSYEAIGQELNMNRSSAWEAVQRALREMIEEPAREVRRLELQRLDKLLVGLWEKATAGDVKVINQVLAILKRRAEMLGLDEPIKIEAETRTVTDLTRLSDSDLEKLESILARAAANAD